MLTYEELEKAVYDWASAQSEWETIFHDPNAPRPALPYLLLKIDSFVQIGEDCISPPNNEGECTISGSREFTLSINAYGDEGFAGLLLLRDSLQKPSVQMALNADGLVFVDHHGVKDLTTLLNTSFEQRAQMDVLFRVGNLIVDTVGYIETVEITGTYKNPNGSTAMTENITINGEENVD